MIDGCHRLSSTLDIQRGMRFLRFLEKQSLFKDFLLVTMHLEKDPVFQPSFYILQ